MSFDIDTSQVAYSSTCNAINGEKYDDISTWVFTFSEMKMRRASMLSYYLFGNERPRRKHSSELIEANIYN